MAISNGGLAYYRTRVVIPEVGPLVPHGQSRT